jgi:hypothetical protein
MARVPFLELLELVKSSPDYYRRWSGTAPADVALAISFGDGEDGSVRTETLDIRNGKTLVLDLDETGRVVGIEIT